MVQENRTISLTALLAFEAVARTGSVTTAASQLGQAKSGISRQIAHLEEHLGVRLFERTQRAIRVTPVGERLAERVRSVLAEVELLSDLAREEIADIRGQVTIAAPYELGNLLATELFPRILENHPHLTLVMRPGYDFITHAGSSRGRCFPRRYIQRRNACCEAAGKLQKVVGSKSGHQQQISATCTE